MDGHSPASPASPRIKKLFLIAALLLLVAGGAFAFLWFGERLPAKRKSPEATKYIAKHFKPPATFAELMKVSPGDLDHCDVALMDLLCAQGLPGSNNSAVSDMLATLDRWAKQVDWDTKMNEWQFVRHPEEFEYSEGKFRMMALVTVLQRKFGVHYNPELMDPSLPGAIFYGDSRNVFINGPLGPGRTGTCSSLPFLYVAVARRLGYPLYVAEAKDHLFAQWDDGKERFNVECTTWGFVTPDDDHYKKWPIPISDDEMKQHHYLHPLNGAEELSALLQNRGLVLVQDGVGDCVGALVCYQKSYDLTPNWQESRMIADKLREAMVEDIEADSQADLPGLNPAITSATAPMSESAAPTAPFPYLSQTQETANSPYPSPPSPSLPDSAPSPYSALAAMPKSATQLRAERQLKDYENQVRAERERSEQQFARYAHKIPIPSYIKEGIVPISVDRYADEVERASQQSQLANQFKL